MPFSSKLTRPFTHDPQRIEHRIPWICVFRVKQIAKWCKWSIVNYCIMDECPIPTKMHLHLWFSSHKLKIFVRSTHTLNTYPATLEMMEHLVQVPKLARGPPPLWNKNDLYDLLRNLIQVPFLLLKERELSLPVFVLSSSSSFFFLFFFFFFII